MVQFSIGHCLSLLLIEISSSTGDWAHSGAWVTLLGRLGEWIGHVVLLCGRCASIDASIVHTCLVIDQCRACLLVLLLWIAGPVVRVRPSLLIIRSKLRVVKAVRLEHDDLVLVALIIHFVGILCVIRDPTL